MTFMLSLFLLGLAVGTFGTLVGIGGGFLLVPLFILLLHWNPQNAVGTSLTVVFFNALSGSLAYIKQKRVYYDAAIRFSIATLPGAFLGSYLVKYFTGFSFQLTFGVLVIFLAFFMFFRPAKKNADKTFDKKTFTYNRPLGILMSVVVGFLSSILGIGGGIIHVPMMIYVLSFPTHIATATSHFILAISTFFGVTSHFMLNHILIKPALIIGAGAVIGAQIGAKLSAKVNSRLIIILLSITLLVLGIRLIMTALSMA